MSVRSSDRLSGRVRRSTSSHELLTTMNYSVSLTTTEVSGEWANPSRLRIEILRGSNMTVRVCEKLENRKSKIEQGTINNRGIRVSIK